MISKMEKLAVTLTIMMTVFCAIYACIASLDNDYQSGENNYDREYEDLTDLGIFSSYNDIENFLDTNTRLGSSGSYRNLDSNGLYRWKYDFNVNNTNYPLPASYVGRDVKMDVESDADDGGLGSGDYSKTNVQEEGILRMIYLVKTYWNYQQVLREAEQKRVRIVLGGRIRSPVADYVLRYLLGIVDIGDVEQ